MFRPILLGVGAIVTAATMAAPSAAPVQAASPSTVSCTAPTGPPAASGVSGGFHGLTPERLADTRATGLVPAGCWLRVDLPASVPAAAEAAVVTVTAVGAPDAGYFTIHSCDSTRDGTSNLNVHVEQPTSNMAVVPVGAGRQLCVYTNQASHVLVDLFGWMGPGGSAFQSMEGYRALDTRSPFLRPPSITGKVAPNERVTLDRARLGVPPSASAVMVNLTVTEGTDWGFLTAFPCAGTKPNTSNVNYDVGVTRASTAIVALDAAGLLCLELGEASAHVIVDVVSWLGGSGGIEFDSALARVADSRDGTGGWSGAFAANETRVLDATADLPAGTQVAMLGIVSTGSTSDGFVQVSPCGDTTETSSLNFVATVDITNLVAAPLAADGTVCITASAPTHLVVDVFGGFGNGSLLRDLDVGPVDVFPAFDGDQTDYVAYCTSNGANTLTVSALGAPGVTATIVGAGSATGLPVSATRSVVANAAVVVEASLRSGETVEYWVRCVPPDFPRVSTNRVAATTPGWYLVGNAFQPQPPGPYAMILDSNGVPVWYRKAAPTSAVVLNLDRWSDGSLTWTESNGHPWGDDPGASIERFALDGTTLAEYQTRPSSADPAPRLTDQHDIVQMPNGNILMISYPVRTAAVPFDCFDATTPGLLPDSTTTVLDAVIQEINPSTNALVKEWRADVLGASPKIDIGSGGTDRGEVTVPICFDIGGMHYDPIHVNSLAISPDGSQVLFTARHLDAVYAIDWASGSLTWKLGGTTSTMATRRLSFEADPFAGPLRPHDVNVLPNGHVTMFDNRATIPIATPQGTGPARYVEYEIDTTGGTATLVRSIRRANGDDSGTMGSGRLQPDGAVVINWGGVPGPVFSEFDADNDLAFEVSMSNFFSYRAIKHPIAAFDIDALRATAGG